MMRRRMKSRNVRARSASPRGSARRQHRKRGRNRGSSARRLRGWIRRRRPQAAPLVHPVRRTVAAVVTVQDGERQLPGVLRELEALAPDDLIVVLDGCAGDSLAAARQYPNALIVHFAEPVGSEACRAAGAGMTDADMLLFVEGGRPIPAERLRLFLEAVRRGADVALADNERQLGPFGRWDDAARLQAFLNRGLNRPDLGACSIAETPHALSRRAIETTGREALAVPPKAQALALAADLRVERIRGAETYRPSSASDRRRAVRLHLEALRTVMSEAGPRLALVDRVRKRQAAAGGNAT